MTILTRTFDRLSQSQTEALAAKCAGSATPGDTLLLDGPIGAGKSTFARAFIRARLASPTEDVPSPTFTIVQTYEDAAGDIWHCDLYRLGEGADTVELGLDEAFESAICLIEWPDRLGSLAPAGALRLAFAAGDAGHRIVASGPDRSIARLFGTDA